MTSKMYDSPSPNDDLNQLTCLDIFMLRSSVMDFQKMSTRKLEQGIITAVPARKVDICDIGNQCE